jgi:hypothetical protein
MDFLWQDQQLLLQKHHLHRCTMVVHVLLWVVVSFVSGATFSDYRFLTICPKVYLSTHT